MAIAHSNLFYYKLCINIYAYSVSGLDSLNDVSVTY